MGERMRINSILAGAVMAAAINCAYAKCAAGTATVFSCPTSNGKFVEVCDAGKTLTYSFGKPSGPPEIDLKVPRTEASTTQWSRTGSNYSCSVEIPNDKAIYSVFTSMDRLSKKHDLSAGVHVYSGAKRLATVNCTGKNVKHDLEGIDLKATTW